MELPVGPVLDPEGAEGVEDDEEAGALSSRIPFRRVTLSQQEM